MATEETVHTPQITGKFDLMYSHDCNRLCPFKEPTMKKTLETRGGPIATSAMSFFRTALGDFGGNRRSRKEYQKWPNAEK